MEEKLIELPFGDKFKKEWLNLVKLSEECNCDTSISTQNHILERYKRDYKTEEEAINFILQVKQTTIENARYRSL